MTLRQQVKVNVDSLKIRLSKLIEMRFVLLFLLLLRHEFAHFIKIAITHSFFKLGG